MVGGVVGISSSQNLGLIVGVHTGAPVDIPVGKKLRPIAGVWILAGLVDGCKSWSRGGTNDAGHPPRELHQRSSWCTIWLVA